MSNVTDEERARLWLNYGVGCVVRQFEAVENAFPSLAAAFACYRDGAREAFAPLPDAAKTRLERAAQAGFLDSFLEDMEKKSIRFTYPKHTDYPLLLAEIADPPSVLYYKGELRPDPPVSIAVIGSRRPTRYGQEIARSFSETFAQAGALVVSGMADGIDACAARGALDGTDARVPTMAVLGTGVDVIYPRSNRALYREIVERGAVVSEFLPGTKAERYNFPIRNRIMSGMAHGTLVVEASERSGTSITAGFALEQGRDVFAIPGRIDDEMSKGPNRMIARGEAKPVLSPADVLEEYVSLESGAVEPRKRTVRFSELEADEKRICRALLVGEASFDELLDQLGITVGALNSCLTRLEISGIMKQLPGRMLVLDASCTILQDD